MPKRPSQPASRARSGSFSEAEILKLARPAIQALKPYVPGRSIEDVRALYRPARIVKLGSNESPAQGLALSRRFQPRPAGRTREVLRGNRR
jgi:hypothetical protein